MGELLKKIQVHVPFRLLREKMLPRVIRDGINPEIGFNHLDIDSYQPSVFRDVADRLADTGLSITFHAPFIDLRPGALDPAIRRISVDRLRRVFDLIPHFRARSVVCHPAFDERYYASAEDLWLENSLETWRTLLGTISGSDAIIALENVYERDPAQIKLLLDSLSSPKMRFCFDAGHANAFGGAAYGVWLDVLGDYLGEIHIHDNNGAADEHLPVGEGNIPFAGIFSTLRRKGLSPILTVESHSEQGLRRMLENLGKMELPDRP